MRLQLGDLPISGEKPPEAFGWHHVRSPSLNKSYLLAALAGMAALTVLCVALGTWSSVVTDRGRMAVAGDVTSPWPAVIVVLVLFIPLHEALHLLGHPRSGQSSQSVLALWPAKLRFGVYYEGCMSRSRWILMRLAPFILLSLLPACLLVVLQLQAYRPELEIGLQVMMLVNVLGSGGDLVAVLIVLRQVPPKAQLCFHAGRAYWKPA